MAMRQLTEEEKSITLKSIARLELDLKISEYNYEMTKLKLEKGLEAQKIMIEKELKESSRNLKFVQNNIKNLKDQIVNGVEVKENNLSSNEIENIEEKQNE